MRRSDRELSDSGVIEEIIKKADVCRIALTNDNVPYIVTLNFGYVANPQRTLYFHCANEGRKLDMILRNNYTCFEMDTDHQLYKGERACDWGMKFSSVVGYGKIFIVKDREERIAGLNSIMRHYGRENDLVYDENNLAHTTILKLEVSEMTGKRKI
jgi:uncharacterized protein